MIELDRAGDIWTVTINRPDKANSLTHAMLVELADIMEEAQAALERALGELGPEVTLEEALRILELSRRANELNPLPRSPGSGVPPR